MRLRLSRRLNTVNSAEGAELIGTLSTLVGINGLLAALSFVTTVAVANHLGADGFGDLAYALAIGGICVTVAFCAINRTLVRDLVHNPLQFDDYTTASIILRGVLLSVALAGAIAIGMIANTPSQLGLAGLLIVFAEGLKALYLAQIFDADHEMRLHASYYLAERLTYFGLLWALIVFAGDRLSLAAIGVAMIVSTAVGIALQYRWVQQRHPLRLEGTTIRLAGRMMLRNVWIWSAILATLSFGALSKVAMKLSSGSEALGLYAVAWQVVILGTLLVSQVARIGDPRMAAMVVSDMPPQQRLRFTISYGVALMAAGAVIGLPAMVAPNLLLSVFGSEFAGAAPAMRILGAYVLIIGPGLMAAQYLVAARLERSYSFVTVLAGALGLFLLVAFIPRWSAVGASVAVSVSHGLGIAAMLVIMLRDILIAKRRRIAPRATR